MASLRSTSLDSGSFIGKRSSVIKGQEFLYEPCFVQRNLLKVGIRLIHNGVYISSIVHADIIYTMFTMY